MERLLRQNGLLDLFVEAPAMFAGLTWRKMRSAPPCEIIWWIFILSVALAIVPGFFGEVAAPLSYVFAIGGAAGCGWAWLLTRTLFRAERPIQRWNLFAVGAIIAVEAYWALTSVSTAGGLAGEVHRIAANAASFICIGALVMVLVESMSGYSAKLPRSERRFRQTFIAVFCVMVGISIIWASNAKEMSFGGQWVELVIAACAFTGVVGSRMAVNFRKTHPLAIPSGRKISQTLSPAAQDQGLAMRILDGIERDNRFTTPDLKVADLAAALGEQDYKVSQSITGTLGYRNFNHLINARRIDHAKQVLADPQIESGPILSIAFDCGFNSIGPFNRAFKQETGMTPRAYRAEAANGNAALNNAPRSELIPGE